MKPWATTSSAPDLPSNKFSKALRPMRSIPDDVFLLNDPYLAAIHQSDIYIVAPIHYRGRLVGWSATFVHVNDIGALRRAEIRPTPRKFFTKASEYPGSSWSKKASCGEMFLKPSRT